MMHTRTMISEREQRLETAWEDAVAGDENALAVVLEAIGPTVRRRVGNIPRQWRSVITMDDIMQQTYTDVFLSWHDLGDRGIDAFTGWMVTRARRNLLDAIRKLRAVRRGGDRRRVRTWDHGPSGACLLDMVCTTSATPNRFAEGSEATGRLNEAIRQLPEIYATVVRLYDLEGMAAQLIADALGRSVRAVYMLRSRAHERLAEIMGCWSRFLSS